MMQGHRTPPPVVKDLNPLLGAVAAAQRGPYQTKEPKFSIFSRSYLGNRKAVYISAPTSSDECELFDLRTDLGEIEDLAKQEPEKFQELLLEYKDSEETGLHYPGVSGKGEVSAPVS